MDQEHLSNNVNQEQLPNTTDQEQSKNVDNVSITFPNPPSILLQEPEPPSCEQCDSGSLISIYLKGPKTLENEVECPENDSAGACGTTESVMHTASEGDDRSKLPFAGISDSTPVKQVMSVAPLPVAKHQGVVKVMPHPQVPSNIIPVQPSVNQAILHVREGEKVAIVRPSVKVMPTSNSNLPPTSSQPAPSNSNPATSSNNPAPGSSNPAPGGSNPAPNGSNAAPSGSNPAPSSSNPALSGSNPSPSSGPAPGGSSHVVNTEADDFPLDLIPPTEPELWSNVSTGFHGDSLQAPLTTEFFTPATGPISSTGSAILDLVSDTFPQDPGAHPANQSTPTASASGQSTPMAHNAALHPQPMPGPSNPRPSNPLSLTSESTFVGNPSGPSEGFTEEDYFLPNKWEICQDLHPDKLYKHIQKAKKKKVPTATLR